MPARQLSRLSGLPQALRLKGYSGIPSYRTLHQLAVDGAYPAQQRNTLWYFAPGDVVVIAAALGLPRQPAGAKTERHEVEAA